MEIFLKLYDEYGYTKEDLVSIELSVKEGQEKISNCIDNLRNDNITEVNNVKVVKYFDYKKVKKLLMD